MKKIVPILLAAAVAFSLAACNSQDQATISGDNSALPKLNSAEAQNSAGENRDSLEYASQEHITQTLSSGVVVDADITILPTVNLDSLKTYRAEMRMFNIEKAKALFLTDKQITVSETYANEPGAIGDTYTYYSTADGFTLASDGTDMYFSSELFAGKVNHAFRESGEVKNDDKFLSGKELSFASIATAQKSVMEVIEELGISVGEPKCYTLDYETFSAENDYFNEMFFPDGVHPFGEALTEILYDDECYVFIFQTIMDDMPVSIYGNGGADDGSYTVGTKVVACYAKDGIVALHVPYEFVENEVILENQKAINVEGALNLLDNKYNSIILEGDYSVSNIAFEYVPMPIKGEKNSFTLVPAWRFTSTHTFALNAKDDSGDTIPWSETSSIVFNAINGDEIISDLGGI